MQAGAFSAASGLRPRRRSAGFAMTTPRRKKYRPWNPQAYADQDFSPADRLPEGDLVFFFLDGIPHSTSTPFYASYEGRPAAGLRSTHA